MPIKLSSIVQRGLPKMVAASYSGSIGQITLGPINITTGMTEMGQINGRFVVMGIFITGLQNTPGAADYEVIADGELVTGSATGNTVVPVYGDLNNSLNSARYNSTPFEIESNLTVRATRNAGSGDQTASLSIYALPLE